MTDTAALAEVVLPAASFAETDGSLYQPDRPLAGGASRKAPTGEGTPGLVDRCRVGKADGRARSNG